MMLVIVVIVMMVMMWMMVCDGVGRGWGAARVSTRRAFDDARVM